MTTLAAVVDDEPLARARLKRLLALQGVDVVAEGENGQQAIEIVHQSKIDILFIDINMPIKNGLDAVVEIDREMENGPAVVFCTAYDSYAIEAFKTNAVAYLLKPFDTQELRAALEKAASVSRMQINRLLENQQLEKTLAIHHEGALQNISVSRFAYFHSTDKHVFAVFTSGEEVLVDQTLKQLESKLEESFIRVHRASLVNRQEASKLIRSDGQTVLELRSIDRRIPVSRRHLPEVKKCFQ